MDLLGRLSKGGDGYSFPATFGQRITAAPRQPPQFGSLLARFQQRHQPCGAQPDVPTLVADHCPQDPTLRAGVVDEQVKAVAVRVAPRSLGVANVHRGEPALWMPPSWLRRLSVYDVC